MYKSIFLFTVTTLVVSCSNGQNQSEKTSLSAIEFSEKTKQIADAQIVDVRTPQEFEQGHIENALNLNWNGSEFENQLATLDKSKPVFVYCLSGGRSGAAVSKMRDEGFQVYEMPGGMMEWRSKNLPETVLKVGSSGMSLEQYKALLHSDKLVLVDFYADWCAPCKKMKPYLEKIAVEMEDKVTLIRINADENKELCKNLNVTALPVLKLYKNNQLTWENLGFIGEEEVLKQLNEN